MNQTVPYCCLLGIGDEAAPVELAAVAMAGVHAREAEVGDGTSSVAGTTTAGAGSRPRTDGANEIWYEAGEWGKKEKKKINYHMNT